ncbi:tetratricopeptide repeat protein [Roseiconus nitratireducens]|uniref:Tetratricopeptide repeat protein n=2 Tax=Roseiconus nitratireducens TaxID=2605748 RepID=A0A5M6DAV4_9BACT|nr:tetratricopeptide repeat protein [Roseiconus nitratireducens]
MDGPKNVGTSLASGTKNAVTKSRDTVAGWFGKDTPSAPDAVPGDETDPVSLAHKAEVSPEVFVANGRLWESTGNFEKAMESYAKALEKRPNDPAALSNIARLHFRQNNHAKAAEYFGKAIEQKPNDAGLYNDLGLTLSKLGNHSAAVGALSQALRLTPNSSRYANNLASVKFESGDQTGALEVLAKNNKPAVAHFNMAYLHYKHGQKTDATRHLNQALSYNGQAETDAATKRAVERSRELLAQIDTAAGIEPGTAIAQAAKASQKGAAPTNAATTNQFAADAAAGNTNPASAPQNVTASGFTPGANVPGFDSLVQPASADDGDATFGNASFKKPSASSGTNPAAATPETATEPAADASAPPKDAFSLPPNFQMP